jgi:hypothetical protein
MKLIVEEVGGKPYEYLSADEPTHERGEKSTRLFDRLESRTPDSKSES